MNPLNPRQITRLRRAMKQARREMQPYRENRYKAIAQYVGNHYGPRGADDRVLLGLIELGVCVYTYQLAARRPKVLVSTPHRPLKPVALLLEMAINRLLEILRVQDAFQAAAQHSLFGLGILKTGLCDGAGTQSLLRMAGQPFFDVIDFDDFVFDIVHAKRMDQCQFMGDRYQMPYDYVMESGAYDRKALVGLLPTDRKTQNEDGDRRAGAIGLSDAFFEDPYKEMVELWDVWLPFDGLMVTLPADREDGPPLRVIEWNGPENGPYEILHYNDVPGNIMPLPPIGAWMDLHETVNALMLKAARQAERQKTNPLVGDGAQEDAERLNNAEDGVWVHVSRPETIKETSTGGADAKTLGMATMLKDMAIYFMGNLDALGGLSPQSDTLGQDQMLVQNASRRIQFMQDRMYAVAERVTRSLAQYLWEDPFIQLPMTYRMPGMDFEWEVPWTPDQKMGDFLSYNFSIVPHSMQYESPSSKLATIERIFQSTVLPFAQIMQQQGVIPNIQGLLRQMGKLGNVSAELEDMFMFAAPTDPRQQMGPVGQPPQKSPVTTRHYVRTNRGSATRHGKDTAMANMLFGMDNGIQEAEQGQLMRTAR